MLVHDLRDTTRELARCRQVQELVRPVRVRMRAEYTGDQELRARKLTPQHLHERNRAALAQVAHGRAKERARRGVGTALEPRRKLRSVPTRRGFLARERDLGPVGRALLEQLLQRT